MRFALIPILILALNPGAGADIRIATVGPLTGPRAWSGEQFRRGAELAVADINVAGGVLGQRVQLIVGDDAQNPDQAVAVARKLVADGVVFVAGHRSSDASIAASVVYNEAEVIQISPSTTNPEFTERGLKNVFRVCGRDDQQGAIAGDYLAAEWRDARIAIVHDESTYGEGLARRTRARLRALGVTEKLYTRFEAGHTDYADLIEELRAVDADVVYVGGYSTDAGLILRQARAEGVKFQLVAGDALHNSDFWAITGSMGEGARSTFGVDPRNGPAAGDITQRLRASGYEPEGYTLHTYAAVQIWAAAVRKAGTLAFDEVTGAMRGTRFDTVLGPLEFDAKGDIKDYAWVWYVWHDGEYVPE